MPEIQSVLLEGSRSKDQDKRHFNVPHSPDVYAEYYKRVRNFVNVDFSHPFGR